MSTRAFTALLHGAFSFWQMELDGLTWLRSHPKGPWEPGGDLLFPSTPQLGLEKLHRGARPSLVSSHLLSWQWETAQSSGADPATDSPNGLGPIPAPPLPPVSRRTPRLTPAGRDPCKRCPCHLHGFLWGFFFVCFLAFNQGSGSRREGEDCDPTLTPSCKHPQSGCTARACPRTGELPTSSCSRRCHSSTETQG